MLVAQHVAQQLALVVQHVAQLVANGRVKLRFVRPCQFWHNLS